MTWTADWRQETGYRVAGLSPFEAGIVELDEQWIVDTGVDTTVPVDAVLWTVGGRQWTVDNEQ